MMWDLQAHISGSGIYKSLFDNHPDGVYAMNLLGTYQDVNPAFEQITGYARNELIGRTSLEIIAPEHRRLRIERLQRTVDGEPQTYSMELLHKHGQRVRVEVTMVPILNENGAVVGIFGVNKDVSERHQLHEHLVQAFSIANLGYWAYDIQKDVMTWSDEIYHMLGLEARGSFMAYSDFMQLVHPDDMKKVWQPNVRNRVESPFDIDIRFIHRDGSIVHTRSKGSFEFDIHYQPMQISGIIQNITSDKRTTLEIAESKEQYRRLIDNSYDVVGMIQHGKWTFMNPSGAKFFGASCAKEIIGQPFEDFIAQDDLKQAHIGMQKMLAGGRAEPTHYRFLRMNGEIAYGELSGFALKDGVIQMIIRDTSDIHRVQQLLIQSEKLSAIGQLGAGVAHEIRNPLTSLKGFMQLIQRGESKQDYFRIMESEFDRIDSILGELLVLARPQALAYVPTEIGAIVRDVTTLLATQAPMRNIEIGIHVQESLAPVHGVPNQLKQVFVNIVKNAIEATNVGGSVQISVAQADDFIVIECMDDGVGIPPDRLARLGEPFFSTKGNGTGLGLMMTQKILKDHQGTISFESVVNQGTRVQVRIPVIRED